MRTVKKGDVPKKYFDEITGPDGKVRDHYAEVYRQWRSMPERARISLHRDSARLYAGDYRQDPFPRILTESELQFLRRGVDQRARAIFAFIQSYCSRDNRWKRVMPVKRFEAILSRHDNEETLSKLQPDNATFPFGPDLIRDCQGGWKVVEDSAGILGGIGDLIEGRKILFRQVPGFRDTLSCSDDPRDFFRELAQYFSSKAAGKGGIPLLYLRAYRDEPDQETRRLAKIFQSFGIETVTATHPAKRLIVEEGGVFLQSRGSKIRIGALIFHASPEQHDARAAQLLLRRYQAKNTIRTRLNFSADLAQALLAPPIQRAILNGVVWSNFSPGLHFVNDKAFGLNVDAMIRVLLQERPILESISATSAALQLRNGSWRLDRKVLARLRKDRRRYVVKIADEDGGGGVWIGQKEDRNSLERLILRMRCTPANFIIQEFEHLSVLENRIVDLRIHAHVDCERIIVSSTPWGRANWLRGNGKVNIGSGGFASPVVVVRDKRKPIEIY